MFLIFLKEPRVTGKRSSVEYKGSLFVLAKNQSVHTSIQIYCEQKHTCMHTMA